MCGWMRLAVIPFHTTNEIMSGRRDDRVVVREWVRPERRDGRVGLRRSLSALTHLTLEQAYAKFLSFPIHSTPIAR